MLYTYPIALVLLLINLYIAKHLYLKDNTKVFNVHIYNIIYFFAFFLFPYLNICVGICLFFFIITKSNAHIEYYYTGIFSKQMNKLIKKYNNFLWLEI